METKGRNCLSHSMSQYAQREIPAEISKRQKFIVTVTSEMKVKFNG